MVKTDNIALVSESRCFNGWLKRYSHSSLVNHCTMHFSVYLPDSAEFRELPVLYWLSGLTCTDENFMQKAGALRIASQLGIILVAPDTSPRGTDLPGEHDHWDFGSGAGFYINATRAPWRKHYNMYDYVVEELPSIISSRFPLNGKQSISGHSMGGHGALICALRNPGKYASVSAFSPICSPSTCPWGIKAFNHYFGPEQERWADWDAAQLISGATEKLPIFIDQGTEDEFLAEQLHPEKLEAACKAHNHPLTLRMQANFDHSYFFISSFIEDHLHHHLYAMEHS
ncbi:S-formylglutathione hydrolase [Parasalinivibrio latis]|uniref:S-formylglutathione hydrolase n=1 Tax=Parasalinivibrio latis TaxID=2952610 RepID=UPI003DA56651